MPPRYSREITRPVVLGPKLKEQFRTSPCEHACPIGNSIQKVHSLIEKGEFTEALRYLRAKNPFPGITGRVCPHFCMDVCNRKEKDSALNIRALERAAEAFAEKSTCLFKNLPATGKKVAVIGGGPAGLGQGRRGGEQPVVQVLSHPSAGLDAHQLGWGPGLPSGG